MESKLSGEGHCDRGDNMSSVLVQMCRSPGIRCEKHREVGFSYCNLCEVERLRDIIDLVMDYDSNLIDSLKQNKEPPCAL